MHISEFDYNLPEELIAQLPAHRRDHSKMMVLNREDKTIHHHVFKDIVDLIEPNSILILNNTRVIPARLYGEKEGTGAKIEIFLLKELEAHKWEALVKPSKRVKPDTVVKVAEELSVRVLKEAEDDGKWFVELIYEGDIYDVLSRVGNVPLPPYIERKMTPEELKKSQ